MTVAVNDGFNNQQALSFLTRNDPLNRWGNIASSYLMLPALRGLWINSVSPNVLLSASAGLMDISGGNNRIGSANTPMYDFENLIPYVELDGSSQYFALTDATSNNSFDILGTEAYIGTPGLTFGMWTKIDAIDPTNQNTIMAKFETTGNQRSYMLYMAGGGANDFYSFNISNTGADGFTVNSSVTVTPATQWYLVIGRFVPSTSLDIYVNGTKDTNTTSIPASIFNSSANFTIGAINTPARYFDGKLSTGFVCAAALSDSIISALFEQTRIPFGA